MNWDQIKGDWHQLSRRLQEKWRLLSDADVVAVAGKRNRLEDILSDRYGYGRQRATIEIDKFAERLSS
jgi:uncharacterized protein YjbJ (UPF0337 family)